MTDVHIAASDKTFDFVSFRGQDIKDLHVHDVETEVRIWQICMNGERKAAVAAGMLCLMKLLCHFCGYGRIVPGR